MTHTQNTIKIPFLSVLSLPGFHGFFDASVYAASLPDDDGATTCVLHCRTGSDRLLFLLESECVDLSSPTTSVESETQLLISHNVQVLHMESEPAVHGFNVLATVDLSSQTELLKVVRGRLSVARKSAEIEWNLLVPSRILQCVA